MIPQFNWYCTILGAALLENEGSLAVIFVPIFKETILWQKERNTLGSLMGYRQIRFLGKNRRNPYGVYPTATEAYDNGQKKPPKALCYVNDWMVGFVVLTAYKAGTYEPGMEQSLTELTPSGDSNLINQILADYNRSKPMKEDLCSPTFTEVYEKFYDWKFNVKRKYSQSSIDSSRTAFKNCSAIHDKPIDQNSYDELQEILDASTLKHSSLELMHSCMKQTFKFALA